MTAITDNIVALFRSESVLVKGEGRLTSDCSLFLPYHRRRFVYTPVLLIIIALLCLLVK